MDLTALVAAERDRLVEVLSDLDDGGWATPSLCAGWTVRDVVAHLLMAYELSVPRFLVLMVPARFSFDRMAHGWAVRDRRGPAELLDVLATLPGRAFNVPGAPPEAPLSHLVMHAEDVHRPLRSGAHAGPEAADTTLDQLTGRMQGLLGAGALDGLALASSDTPWRHGDGATVEATSSALLVTLGGRTAALDELEGPGADLLRTRVLERAVAR